MGKSTPKIRWRPVKHGDPVWHAYIQNGVLWNALCSIDKGRPDLPNRNDIPTESRGCRCQHCIKVKRMHSPRLREDWTD